MRPIIFGGLAIGAYFLGQAITGSGTDSNEETESTPSNGPSKEETSNVFSPTFIIGGDEKDVEQKQPAGVNADVEDVPEDESVTSESENEEAE